MIMRHLTTVSAIALLLALAAPAQAGEFKGKEAGDWLVRGRLAAVVPMDGGTIENRTTGIDAGLDINDITNSVIPELDISYFWTKTIATELVLGTTPHKVKATGGIDVGDVWLLPPTLTVQYHPMPDSAFSPYFGAGINYTIFYGEGDGLAGFDVRNSFGLALQAGFDYQLSGPWSLNFDVKKLFLRPEAVTSTLRVDEVKIDPWIVGIGIGYRF
jgi:outer membrane protein